MQFLLVLSGILHEVHILRRHDHVLRPMAKEFNIGHQVEVWLPEGIVSLDVLIDKKDDKRDLFPIVLLIL